MNWNSFFQGTTLDSVVPVFILAFLLVFFVGVLWKAHQSPQSEFDIAGFLRDDQGKESSTRLFSFVALAVHSWWVATLVFQKAATVDHFLYYGLIWAGTPVIKTLAERWGGNLPFSQPGHPPSGPNHPAQ